MVLLVHPPVAKPSEPPAGIARLAGTLGKCGVKHRVLDANMEALLYMAGNGKPVATDTWTMRAFRGAERNIGALREKATYQNMSRYRRAVMDFGRVLCKSSLPAGTGATVGLANYSHESLSPLRSLDLIGSAEKPEGNPFYGYFSGRLRGLMEAEEPGIVGFSVNFFSQALCAFAMAGFVRARYPGVRVVMGGGLVTSWLRRPGWGDKNPFAGLVDRLVAGQGEGPLLSMLGVDAGGCGGSWPDYSGFALSDYLSPGFILPYSGSSGCRWGRCSFCPERAEGNPYIEAPAKALYNCLGSIPPTASPSLMHLLDNSISPALMRHLIDNPPGVPWYGFARVSEELGDFDYCLGLRRSGCVMLKLGIESGDQGVLDAMKKGMKIEDASMALKALKKAGIATYVYLLFGTPAESYAEAERTLDFTARHAGEIGFLNLAIFNMPAFGPEAHALDASPFYEGDLTLYTNFAHPLGWDRIRVRKFIEGEFKRHPEVSEIVRRTLPVFTSNHAAFFV